MEGINCKMSSSSGADPPISTTITTVKHNNSAITPNNISNNSLFCSNPQMLDNKTMVTLLTAVPPPVKAPATSGYHANFLADTLGVSPLYQQQDSQRWQTAAKVYQYSRSQVHSPISGTGAPLRFTFGETLTADGGVVFSQKYRQCRSIGSPISLEDIANVNRQLHREMEIGRRPRSSRAAHGSLELEAIAAVHELSTQVKQISVSEILPRTADLIFVNIKTYDDLPYTLELTMKGWRICSTHSDCMNGDYHNVALHIRYFRNAKEVLDCISPDHDKHFNDCLTQRLKQLEQQEEKKKRELGKENMEEQTGSR